MIDETLKEIVEQIILNNEGKIAFRKINNLAALLQRGPAESVIEYFHDITFSK